MCFRAYDVRLSSVAFGVVRHTQTYSPHAHLAELVDGDLFFLKKPLRSLGVCYLLWFALFSLIEELIVELV